MIERGTSIICGKGCYTGADNKRVWVSFKDSYKMIPSPLRNFPKMFALQPKEAGREYKKEVMPYTLFDPEFVTTGRMIATGEQLKSGFPEIYDEMRANLEEWECELPPLSEYGEGDSFWDMCKYAEMYCAQDVQILNDGWQQFRTDMVSYVDEDPNAYLTIASLAHSVMMHKGCYEGVYAVSGLPLSFIKQTNVGGRVMMHSNRMQRVVARVPNTPIIDDDDMNSLYPFSMFLIGYPMGPPKVWDESVDLERANAYYVEILVTKVGKHRPFPVTPLRSKDGTNLWTSDLEGETICVDDITLGDLVEFMQIEYTVLRGYYFDEGENRRINEVIKDLYDLRLELKKDKNPAQAVIKLVMNSSYGTTGMAPHDTDIKYVDETRLPAFIANHHAVIKEAVEMPNGEHRVSLYRETQDHYNLQHISSRILAQSKRSMNEVMQLADDIGVLIFYTDTDSMQVEAGGLARLSAAYYDKYGRTMHGDKLGEFSSDFEFGGAYSRVPKPDGSGHELVPADGRISGSIKGVEGWFPGKKTYLVRIGQFDESGVMLEEAYHIRCKGVPINAFIYKVNNCYDGDPGRLFDAVMSGEEVKVEMGGDTGSLTFKTGKNHEIQTLTGQFRTIRFDKGEGVVHHVLGADSRKRPLQ